MLPMSYDFRFSSLSYFHRPLVGLLACLVRGADGLRGLCVALCSRLIASVSSGILFPVPCDGFLSAFLFLARCCCMSGFTPSLYRSRPTPSSFLLGYQGRGRFFFIDLPACSVISLAHLMSCPSAACFVCCGYHDSISYRPVPRPACSTRGAGRFMATERTGYQAVIAAAVGLLACLLAGGTANCVIRAWMEDGRCHLSHETMRMCGNEIVFSLFFFARPPLAGSLRLACLDLSPAPGRGMSQLLSICGCGRDTDLLASNHVMSLSRSRSFAIAVRFACDAVSIAPCRAICLGCLIASVSRLPVF